MLLSRLEVQRETQGGRRRRVNLHYNSLACVCRAPVSALTAVFAGLKSDRCIAACITVLCHEQGGRGRLLVRATRVFRPKESAVDRVFSRACVFSLVLDTKQVRRLSLGKYVIRGPWEPLVASSLRSNTTFQGSRGPQNHVFSATSASNLYV